MVGWQLRQQEQVVDVGEGRKGVGEKKRVGSGVRLVESGGRKKGSEVGWRGGSGVVGSSAGE